MTSKMPVGWRVYGLGVIALAVISLAWGDFDFGQPVPKSMPGRIVLAYVVASFMLIAGAAIEWRRSTAWGAGALTVYFTLIVVVLMYGRVALTYFGEFGTYSGMAEQLAIASGGLIIVASAAAIDATRARRLTRLGVIVFGVCALLFGGAHFVYIDLTVPFVPTWLPPSQTFWGYATGVGHVAAGIALLTRLYDRLAAILLTIMYASFAVLVHAPRLIADAGSRENWSESATNLALVGVAWVVAESLGRVPARGATIDR